MRRGHDDDDKIRFVDSDGHVLEHPTGMLDYAPPSTAMRIWHIETDADGTEWLLGTATAARPTPPRSRVPRA